jgi:hypothetical protein
MGPPALGEPEATVAGRLLYHCALRGFRLDLCAALPEKPVVGTRTTGDALDIIIIIIGGVHSNCVAVRQSLTDTDSPVHLTTGSAVTVIAEVLSWGTTRHLSEARSLPHGIGRNLRGHQRTQVAAELAERFRRGPMPITTFAHTVGLGPCFVRRLLTEAGVCHKPTCLGMSGTELGTCLATRYQLHPSVDELIRLTGLDRRTIRTILTDQGVRLRTHNPITTGRIPVLIEQYRNGATLRDLAKETGASCSTVRRTLVDNGVTLRRTGPRKKNTPGEHS